MLRASVETTPDLWAASLRDVKRRIRPLFTQERVARSAEKFLEGLLGEDRRKNGWMRAGAAGDPGPWRQQAILGRGRWDAEALRDVVRSYALHANAYISKPVDFDRFHDVIREINEFFLHLVQLPN